MKTLMTAWEVILNSPVDRNFPPTDVCNHVYAAEMKVFGECLSLDFRDVLIADLADYATDIGQDIVEYDPNTTYTLAGISKIYYMSVVWTLLKDGDVVPPWEDIRSEWWEVADKFNTECYQDLWDEGMLKQILAFETMIPALTYTTFKASGKGITRNIGDPTGVQTASMEDFNAVKRQLINNIQDRKNIMYAWLQAKYDDDTYTCDFSTIPFLTAACDEGCTTRKTRRILFKS